jgi:ATP-dependent DNA helicase PIF1
MIEEIVALLLNGKNVLLHSPGGCGKTHVAKEVAVALKEKGTKIAFIAPTGIAALNLAIAEHGIVGRTIHSWGGLGMGDESIDSLKSRIKYKNAKALKRWKDVQFMIIDEISMVGKKQLEELDVIAKYVRDNYLRPMGGIRVLFCGDFLQLPPVKDDWAFESDVWKKLEFVTKILSEPKRYTDTEWFERLQRFRVGEALPDDDTFLRSRYDEYTKIKKTKNTINDVKPTILYCTNADVDMHNAAELRALKMPPVTYCAKDINVCSSIQKIKKYQKMLDEVIPRVVVLAKGAQVMLRANLDINAGLANGTRGVVMEADPSHVVVKWAAGFTTDVQYNNWKFEKKKSTFQRYQIPLVLAWSMTVHKSQGITLDCVVCDIGTNIFLPGQAYVALSRVRSSAGLYLSSFYPPSIRANAKALDFAKNVGDAKTLESTRSVSDAKCAPASSPIRQAIVDENEDDEVFVEGYTTVLVFPRKRNTYNISNV